MAGKDSVPPLRPGRRRCLKCLKTFSSWDVPRNCICPKCTSRNDRAPKVVSTRVVDYMETSTSREDI